MPGGSPAGAVTLVSNSERPIREPAGGVDAKEEIECDPARAQIGSAELIDGDGHSDWLVLACAHVVHPVEASVGNAQAVDMDDSPGVPRIALAFGDASDGAADAGGLSGFDPPLVPQRAPDIQVDREGVGCQVEDRGGMLVALD